METPLSQREFDIWCRSDKTFKERIDTYMTVQTEINLNNSAVIATLQARQEECQDQMDRRTTWVSAVISAIVGGIVGLFAGRG
jgi:hypothetical protein